MNFASYLPPRDEGLDIVYRDEAIIVLNKPAGLLSVPGRGTEKQDSLSVRIKHDFADALVVHRLDMATSGLMVFARGALMQQRFSQMFREQEVNKRYVAVVAGKMERTAGEVNLPIVADWPNRPLRKIDIESGKPSVTRFQVLIYDADTDTSRVELEPVTGRTHQLRVHMAAIGHPILGDALYGGVSGASTGRLLLHASELSFAHPLNEEPLGWVSEPPF